MIVQGYLEKNLYKGDHYLGYRVQNKPKNTTHKWPHYNFTRNPQSNRWTPENDTTTYFGLDAETAIVESFKIFRSADDISMIPPKTPVAQSELEQVDIISIKFNDNLNLLDFTNSAETRHRIGLPIQKTIDITLANQFSTLVHENTDLDGIFYETRFGGSRSIVIYGRAKEKVQNATELRRESLYEYLIRTNSRKQIEERLSISILDGF